MQKQINGVTLTLSQGNIVNVEADAIVNAANAALAGGGGVDGAIHRAAGPKLMEESRKIGGCPTGSAVATGAGRLKAQHVFHAVGPMYLYDEHPERLLASAYQACLDLADRYSHQSIAFPSISTGAYGYPVRLAADIALKTAIEHSKKTTSLRRITFVLFDAHTLQIYEQVLQKLLGEKIES